MTKHNIQIGQSGMLMVFFIAVLFNPAPVPAQQYIDTGYCSYYGKNFHGRYTASGERFDNTQFTAAHLTLPFNTLLKVTNLQNQKSVVVRVNDRGPLVKSRILDVSYAAAKALDMIDAGVIKAEVKYAGMANADSIKEIQAIWKRAAPATGNKSHAKPQHSVQKTHTNVKGELIAGGIYDQQLNLCSPRGYGVHAGLFHSLSDCRHAMHEYIARYNTNAYIVVVQKNKTRLYQLVLGRFATKYSAEELCQAIKNNIPSCYVIKFNPH